MSPITILQNKMGNLPMDDLSCDAQDKLAGMMKTLNRLKRIVNSLLLISCIENEQFAKAETMNLATLVNEIAKELQDRIDARNSSALILQLLYRFVMLTGFYYSR